MFEGFIHSFYSMILPCILMMRHEHIPDFLWGYF